MTNYTYLLCVLISCLLFSCNEKNLPVLEGVWVEVYSKNELGNHSFYQRNPIIIDFEEGGTGSYTSYASRTGIRIWEEKINWIQTSKHIILNYPNSADSLRILYQSKDSLMVNASSGEGNRIIRVFKKLDSDKSKIHETDLDARLRRGIFVTKIPSWSNKANIPFQTEFVVDRYFMPADSKTLDIMRFWSVVSYKKHTFLIMDGLTERLQSWDMIEVEELSDEGIKGNYYYKGKRVDVFLKEQKTDLPELKQLREIERELTGKWDLKPKDSTKLVAPPPLPQNIDTRTVYKGECLTFYATGDMIANFYAFEQKGKWWLSKTGSLIITKLDDKFSYIRLGERSADTILCMRRNFSTGRPIVETVFQKIENAVSE